MISERPDTLGLLARLVAFDTTSRNSNLDLIAFVEEYLAGHGVTSRRVDYDTGKTNLYATIGPQDVGGIALSGHTDVVPVDGQAWDSDPFAVEVRDGRAYGRGTADMKGFLAAVLAKVPAFLERPLKTPIHIAFSCDEEVGCRGVRPLIADLAARAVKPRAVIVGEPTLMQVVDAHKAAHTFETEVLGHEAHSSNAHQGVNAIMEAGGALAELNRLEAEWRGRGDPSGRFMPPFSTLQVGLIEGGTAKNIIPRRCQLTWETRLLPDADPGEAEARIGAYAEARAPIMQAVAPDTGISTRCTNRVPGLKPDPGSPAESLALVLARANGTAAVSYATEAGFFQEAGMPAVICGPGSIDQAHKPNEFIALSELEKCEAFLDRLAAHCRG